MQKFPEYPDPTYYLNQTTKYFFRSHKLQHLRIEQYVRFYTASREMALPTNEDTILDEEVVNANPDTSHKNYDRFSEAIPEGTRLASDYTGVEVVRRRGQPRLAVPYRPTLEPLGQKREAFYQQKLLLGLSWFCPDRPTSHEDGTVEWHFRWMPPPPSELRGGIVLEQLNLSIGRDEVSFEGLCCAVDNSLSSYEYALACQCCARVHGDPCESCQHAIGSVSYTHLTLPTILLV